MYIFIYFYLFIYLCIYLCAHTHTPRTIPVHFVCVSALEVATYKRFCDTYPIALLEALSFFGPLL